ncbi:MAG: YidC/Oxa1 family membrane protein insertase [Fusobacteriaceae bacterium]
MAFLYDLLAKILTGLYDLTGNFGLAIIGITILTKIVTLPLTLKQDKSMRAMKEIQPEIEKLKAKYKDEPKVMQQKTMELYKEKKINPAGGCLPLLIQMPILFALFGVLRTNPEIISQAGEVVYPFIHLPTIPSTSSFLWLSLGTPDPYYVFPLLNGALSFLQQKLTGSGDSNPQMKNMMYMFPIMMIFISYKMPGGLQLYWVVSSLAGIIQQYWIIKRGERMI